VCWCQIDNFNSRIFHSLILVDMEVKWNKLDVKLSPSTKKTIQEMGFKTMTPVQVRLGVCFPCGPDRSVRKKQLYR